LQSLVLIILQEAAKIHPKSAKMNDSKPRTGYLSQFGILLALIGGGFIAAVVAMAVMAIVMLGGAVTDANILLRPENASAAKAIQLVASALMFLLPAVVFARIISQKPYQYLGFNSKFNWVQVGQVVLIALLAMNLSGALAELNRLIPLPAYWHKKFTALEAASTEQVVAMATMHSWPDYLFSLLVMAIAPAFFEEILFRGAIQSLIERWSKNGIAAIIITSLFFSAIHFSYFGFLSRFALGVIMGLIFYQSRNLWLCILMHFINNAFIVTQLFIMNNTTGFKKEDLTKAMEETMPLWMGAIALGGLFFLFQYFKKQCNKWKPQLVQPFHQFPQNPFEEVNHHDATTVDENIQ
jgi:uncharacterized protein